MLKKLIIGKILNKINIVKNIFSLEIFIGEIVNEIKAGQFCSVYVDSKEHLLPRPISICDVDLKKQTITLVFAVVGNGTEFFSKLNANEELKILIPLGNGFQINLEKKNIAIVGGGIGIPPLYLLAKEIEKSIKDVNINVFLGFRDETFLLDKFEKFKTLFSTDSGKSGFKGNVVELLETSNEKFDIIYACGPKIMLKGLQKFANEKNIDCQISMEERMACSIGACVGCVTKIKTSNGFEFKKVCVDGPIFNSKDVIFDE